MDLRRVLVLTAALALSAHGLAALPATVAGHDPPAAAVTAPALPAAVTAAVPAPVAHVARPGHWSVVVDGWYIELDGVAGVHSAAPETAESVPSLLSPYDQLIGKYAEESGLDWRFVAAVIYEESHFEPDSVSEAGAYGLMQVRPIAAREVGEVNFQEPEANIRTGVHYLQRLEREYAAASDRHRQALMLAAYNMGLAHVQDAQALARRFGYDPLRWDGAMDVMVSLLEEPHVYQSAPNGYAHGRAVVEYVDRVLRRYAAYRRDLPALPPGHIVQTAAATP